MPKHRIDSQSFLIGKFLIRLELSGWVPLSGVVGMRGDTY